MSAKHPIGSLLGLDTAAWARWSATAGLSPAERRRLWTQVFHHGRTQPQGAALVAKTPPGGLSRPGIVREETSRDGTRKWLLALDDGERVETVFIPDEDGPADTGALCVSSQVGCTLTCSFCHTGTQGLRRNLTAAEIVGQVMLARDRLDDWPSNKTERRVRSLVLMGMGEPLYNYDAVAQAVRVLNDPSGLAISRRRITLSTAGVVPFMQRCGRELGVNLAVSLHATTNAVRDVLVPINRKWPIERLLDACRAYPTASNARRIVFEYVLLDGVNDSDADARRLAALVRDVPAKVNLIPFNPWPGTVYRTSPDARVHAFADILHSAGLSAPIRWPRGRDILAACGQLRTAAQ